MHTIHRDSNKGPWSLIGACSLIEKTRSIGWSLIRAWSAIRAWSINRGNTVCYKHPKLCVNDHVLSGTIGVCMCKPELCYNRSRYNES